MFVWFALLACRPEVPPPGDDDDDTGTTATTGATAETGTTAPKGSTADTGPAGIVVAAPGVRCAPEDTLGTVQLQASDYGPTTVYGLLWNQRDPWLEGPDLTAPTCSFYSFSPVSCGTCPPGEVCSTTGVCVPERRTEKHVTLEVTTGSEQATFASDPMLGTLYGDLAIGSVDDAFGMHLAWDDVEIVLAPMPIASGDLGDVHVAVASNDFFHPGALTATWDAPPDGGHVHARIPINHHASGPTFTECTAPGESEAFQATAPMVDPLAVVTGLEFQGLGHWQYAAAQLAEGCVEFRFGRERYVPVEVPP